ncbi:hypothetical protein DEAC_c29320 [Desulfosporosinus acididurans]|uniref:Uncharacterized protein n=1 Tax=Desulfosporosinus acididurans TaxID=476652 RepID=A0A0J1FNB9_9FIRM|nr:hypothetical protein DEAC_c29320 [Desulfosporosinus acididurans]
MGEVPDAEGENPLKSLFKGGNSQAKVRLVDGTLESFSSQGTPKGKPEDGESLRLKDREDAKGIFFCPFLYLRRLVNFLRWKRLSFSFQLKLYRIEEVPKWQN